MDISQFMQIYFRPATGDVRFTAPALWDQVEPEHGLNMHGGRYWRPVHAMIMAAGAVCVGKARVNSALGGGIMKDTVYSVPLDNWQDFCRALSAEMLSYEGPVHKPKPPTTAERLTKLEARLDGLEAILLSKPSA